MNHFSIKFLPEIKLDVKRTSQSAFKFHITKTAAESQWIWIVTKNLKKFMEKATTNEFKQLSVLSPDYHIHTIEVSNKDIFEEIKKELRDKNILFE